MSKRFTTGSLTFLGLIVLAYTPAVAGYPSALIGAPPLKSSYYEETAITIQSTADNARPSATTIPLANMLTTDGRLNLPPGFSGSLDPNGWELANRGNEPPRFVQSMPGDEKWVSGSGPNGVNGWVNAVAVDGSGNVYVGGGFNLAGNLPVRNIAKWDGVGWSTLGYGLEGDVITLLWDPVHGWLYAGGFFTGICLNAECSAKIPSRGVARWNPGAGGSWHALGYGVNGTVRALAVDPAGNLYAGGIFQAICSNAECSSGMTVNHIAEWNPAGPGNYLDWSSLASAGGVGVTDGDVSALAWWNALNVLLVGGHLHAAGGVPMNHLTMWDPSGRTWNSFWSGTDESVQALEVDPATGTVIVGGYFYGLCEIGAVPPNCGNKTPVKKIAIASGLYWGGPTNGIIGGIVSSLSLDAANKRLYVGGVLSGTCNDPNCQTSTPVSNIARWDYNTITGPGSWSALGTGLNDVPAALVWNPQANLLYAGGGFRQAGTVPATSLAAWNQSSWSTVGAGNGVSPSVYAVAADGNGRVYVGGDFRTIGNQFANRVAVWDNRTNTWSPLGHGLNSAVCALTLDPSGNLYVGGAFRFLCGNMDCSSRGQRVNGVAKWTPSGDSGVWSGVGPGFNDGRVTALVLDRNHNLYAGGAFKGICADAACSTHSRANRVAVWDGQAWSKLGDGLNNDVKALAVDRDNNLYVGGAFWNFCGNADCTTSGPRVNSIAKWTPGGGGSWSAVGNGLDREVLALVVDRNNTLYAGGPFSYICSAPGCNQNTQKVSGIAQWNGSAWSAVGQGLKEYGYTKALVLDEKNNLYAGGIFRFLCGDADCFTSGAPVNHLAKWDGTHWSALGSGVGPFPGCAIEALTISRGLLSVGGFFSTAGDKVSANFARYTLGTYTFLPLIKR